MLADASAPMDYDRIDVIMQTTAGVYSYHDFRCRGGKPGEIFCDLHVVVDPEITVREAHLIGNRVRDRMKAEVEGGVVDVMVHIDRSLGMPGQRKQRKIMVMIEYNDNYGEIYHHDTGDSFCLQS